jgi:type I restriction enzyme S subunit
MVKLGDVVSFIGGSQPPKSTFLYEPKKGFVRLLQIRDYKSDKNLTFIPETSTKKFCTKDDVMIGRYGPPVFQILQGLEGAYNVALMKAKPSEKVDRDYLYYFLKQDELFRLIDGL